MQRYIKNVFFEISHMLNLGFLSRKEKKRKFVDC
jgi:hypothetical protein